MGCRADTRSDALTSARTIVNDDILSQTVRKFLRDRPTYQIHGATRRRRHHQALTDRLIRRIAYTSIHYPVGKLIVVSEAFVVRRHLVGAGAVADKDRCADDLGHHF